MSTTYVDGTTPLNAANMNALQQKVEKAAANGYASLDATGKVPAAQLPAAVTGIPLPVVNGQWIKGVGGAAVWQPIAYADLPGYPADATKFLRGDGSWQVPPAGPAVGSSPSGSITAANTDLTPTTLVTTYTIYPNGGGTIRSIVGPAQGAVVHFWNASSSPVTFKNALSGGTGAMLQNKGSVDLILNPYEGVSYAWDGGGNWREVGEARTGTLALIQKITPGAGNAVFSSIPATFSSLKLVWTGRNGGGGDASVAMQFNNDTGSSNYTWEQFEVLNGSGNNGQGVSGSSIRVAANGSDGMAAGEILLPNYNLAFQKIIVASYAMASSNSNRVGTFGCSWNNTAVISTISVSSVNGWSGSTMWLYGMN